MEIVVTLLVAGIVVLSGIRKVPADMWYVVERLGSYHTTLEEGVHFIIPLVDQIVRKIPHSKRILETRTYSIKAMDGTVFMLDPQLEYSVVDVINYTYGLRTRENLERAIVQIVEEEFQKKTVEEICRRQRELGDIMKRNLLEKAKGYGIEIHYFRLKTEIEL
ncbi:MAG: SPFH domain-containing protein [Eubacteriales bacterium]